MKREKFTIIESELRFFKHTSVKSAKVQIMHLFIKNVHTLRNIHFDIISNIKVNSGVNWLGRGCICGCLQWTKIYDSYSTECNSARCLKHVKFIFITEHLTVSFLKDDFLSKNNLKDQKDTSFLNWTLCCIICCIKCIVICNVPFLSLHHL